MVNTDALPASITNIPDDGFGGTGIETLTMPNVTSIGESAFATCSALTDITLPSILKSIGLFAFTFCDNLTKVTINGNPTMDYGAIQTEATLILKVRTNTGDGASWATFYNDRYNFKAGSAKVYKATVADGKVCLTEVADKIVNAGTAVVLKWGESNSFIQMNRTDKTSTDEHPNDLQGLNARTYIHNMLAGDYAGCTFYVLSDKGGVGFYRYSSDQMPQNKAFIALPPSAGVREMLTFSEDGATGIATMESGQGISDDGAGAWYTLDGRRLAGKPAQKGIYVHQGRKEVIR